MPDIAKVILYYTLKSKRWTGKGKGRRDDEGHGRGRQTMTGFSAVHSTTSVRVKGGGRARRERKGRRD